MEQATRKPLSAILGGQSFKVCALRMMKVRVRGLFALAEGIFAMTASRRSRLARAPSCQSFLKIQDVASQRHAAVRVRAAKSQACRGSC